MGCSVTQNSGRSLCMKLYCILNFDPPSLSFLLKTQFILLSYAKKCACAFENFNFEFGLYQQKDF